MWERISFQCKKTFEEKRKERENIKIFLDWIFHFFELKRRKTKKWKVENGKLCEVRRHAPSGVELIFLSLAVRWSSEDLNWLPAQIIFYKIINIEIIINEFIIIYKIIINEIINGWYF